MTFITGAALWVSGSIFGFAWGLGKALRDPIFARGFLDGFYYWVPKRKQKPKDQADE